MNITLRCDFFVLDDSMLRYHHFHAECERCIMLMLYLRGLNR